MNLWTINETGEVDLSFHPGQWRAWNSVSRFPFVIAGTQGGKTSFGPWWLLREIYDPDVGRGGGDYLAVTASYDLFKLKMLPELRTVFESVQNVGRYWAGDKVLELRDPATGQFHANRSDDPMWGRIILRSAQAGGGLEASTAKGAWLDECGQDDFTLEDWEAVQRRLSLAEGRALGTTTPYNLGWLKSQVYDPWTEGDPDFDVISFASTQNPAFPKREFKRVQRKMQDWRFGMFYEGRFTRPAGLIYASFTDEMLVDPFAIPDDWTRYTGVDFGGANNAILQAAEDPATEIIYIYDEWLGGGETSADYAERARGIPDECESYAWGGAHSEGQARRDWGAAGFWIDEPAIRDVEQGIDRVTELIKGDRLRVFRTLKGFRDEIGSYKRKLDAAGDPLEEIENKRRYHRMDALRYMAVGIIEQAGPWVVLV
jgi:hypothetical protein